MTQPTNQPIRPATGTGREPWWSTRTSQRLVKFATHVLLELLPVEAALVVMTGYSGQNITESPVPVWFLLGTFLLAWSVGRYLIGASLQRIVVISSPLLTLCAFLLIRISPAAYGPLGRDFFDWSWILSLGSDIANQRPQANAIPPLLLLLVYVWWRGLRLGSDPPDYTTVMNRFKYGMIAMVAITIASIGIPGVLQQQVVGVLGLLLTLEVFAGLVAAAVGRMALNQVEHHGDAYLITNDRLWLGTALILATVTVGFALLINLIINYQSVGALLTLLGPVGPFVSKLATLLANGLAQLLRFLFDWLIGLFKPTPARSTSRLPFGPVVNGSSHSHKALSIPKAWLLAAAILLEGVSIIIVILLFLWLMRTIITRKLPRQDVLDEERESLDASSIFRNQLRAFLAGLRPTRAAAWIDPLRPGSVRYLYREFLEAASRRGLPRQISETPDEYGARLATSPLLAAHDAGEQAQLRIMSEAYDTTRYAERPPDEEEMVHIRQQAKTLTNRLKR